MASTMAPARSASRLSRCRSTDVKPCEEQPTTRKSTVFSQARLSARRHPNPQCHREGRAIVPICVQSGTAGGVWVVEPTVEQEAARTTVLKTISKLFHGVPSHAAERHASWKSACS